ncbi:MAG: TonB-dependent receptor [Ignavibacteria bacterium]|jgi:outer membrane receptor protein involved in Fe transport
MKLRLLALFLCMLTAPLSAIAGLYGTLSGKVTDDKGKPVVGATVRVQGTTRGAFVKADGKYIVVNIPAGTYTVVFKAVNYKDFKATVSISADQTTELNARMQEATVTSNAVVVDAKKEQNMVSKTQIGSLRSNQGEDNIRVARETVQGIVALNAGVQGAGNGFQIRGSRANETQIRVDGLEVSDRFSGGFGSSGTTYSPTVSNFAVEEVQVLTGGFSAEYGNVIGGFVNTVVKTGRTDRYEGFIRWRRDLPALFGEAGNGVKLMNKDENSFDIGIGGPLQVLENATFFLTGRYAREIYGGASLGVLDPAGNNLGQLPNQETWVRNMTGRMKFNFSDLSVTLGGQIGLTSRERMGWGWLYADDFGVKNQKVDLNTGRLTSGDTIYVPEYAAKMAVVNNIVNNAFIRVNQTLSSNSFFEFTVSSNSNNNEIGKRMNFDDPGIFGTIEVYKPQDLYQPRTNTKSEFPSELVETSDGAIDWFQSAPRTQRTADGYLFLDIYQRNPLTGYIEDNANSSSTDNPYGLQSFFNRHGNERNFEFRSQNFLQFDGFYNANIDAGEITHNFKAGFEVRSYELRRHNNSLPWDGNPFFDIYTDEYGGNIYSKNAINPQVVNDRTGKPMKPIEASGYVQDQIKYKGIIINAGLRFDMTNPNAIYRSQRSNVWLPISSTEGFSDATVKFQLSPRLAITYPVTDRSIFTLAYGVYFQMPNFSYMYDGFNTDRLRGNTIVGNPNMEAQRTNAYQVSYNLQLSDDFAFDLTAYYKDIYNQVGIRNFRVVPDNYQEYAVAEYGSARGIEFTLRKRPTNHIGFNINYTLASVSGTSSSPESNYALQPDPYTGQVTFPLSEFPFNSDRRHVINAIIDFVWGREEGIEIAGMHPMENMTISFTNRFLSGTPYTRQDRRGNPIGEFNAERQPSFFSTDLRITKAFMLQDWFGESMGRTSLQIFADVFNLFNRTDVVAVFARTQDPDNDGDVLDRMLGDFSPVIWYRDANLSNPSSFQPTQYDIYGERLYREQADFNKDGIVTQEEKYESYKDWREDRIAFRGNYQTPRSAFFGMMINF